MRVFLMHFSLFAVRNAAMATMAAMLNCRGSKFSQWDFFPATFTHQSKTLQIKSTVSWPSQYDGDVWAWRWTEPTAVLLGLNIKSSERCVEKRGRELLHLLKLGLIHNSSPLVTEDSWSVLHWLRRDAEASDVTLKHYFTLNTLRCFSFKVILVNIAHYALLFSTYSSSGNLNNKAYGSLFQ